MFMFTSFVVIFGAGLILGWNVLPQPKWVRRLWEEYVPKF